MPRPPTESPRRRGRHASDDAELIARALRWNEVFGSWPLVRQEELLKSARLERYARHARVLARDRHPRDILVVVSGSLEISSLNASGRKYVNTLLGPGMVAPLVRLLEDAPVNFDYHAHEDALIIHLHADAVVAVLDAEPVLWREVARLALQRQRLSLSMLHGLTLGTVRRRIAATLLTLAEYYGAPQESGMDLRVRLPQQELAALLGLSRQTISKQLRTLADEGTIAMSYKRVALLDMPALARIAAGE